MKARFSFRIAVFLCLVFVVAAWALPQPEDGAATEELRVLGETPLLASVFVICELQAGARLSANPDRELRSVERFAENLTIVYPDGSFAVAYAETQVALRRVGSRYPRWTC